MLIKRLQQYIMCSTAAFFFLAYNPNLPFLTYDFTKTQSF